MARRQGLPLVGILALGLLGAAPAFGQSSIVLDGSLPNGRTDNVTAIQPGPDYVIGEDLGWQVGRNLFHSFSKFDIGAGQSATFTDDPALNSGLPPIGNVIARVTGGNPSQIDGLLRSTIPNADVFLLNPSGVVFGGQASIDVPASFTVSTAQQLVFAGGETLSTGVAANPVLSAAPPEAFGFLGGAPAADLEFLNTNQSFPRFYQVPDGETFTAIGGNVRVMNSQEPGLPPGQSSQLVAFGGRVQVAAAGSAAVVVPLDLATWKVAPDPSTHLGEVHLEKGALDTLPFDPAGPQGEVVIRGGRLTLADHSFVRGGGQVPGGPAVDIAVAKDVTLDLSELRTESLSEEPAGALLVSSSEIALRNQSLIQSSVFDLGGSAPGGDVSLEAARISLSGGSAIETTTSGSSPGGAVHLDAQTVALDGATITSSSEGSGAAGDIAIQTGDLTLSNTAQIVSASGVGAPAGVSGGSIDIVASGTVRVSDGAAIESDAPGASAGGNIHIEAGDVRIARDGGALPGAVRASVDQLASGAGGSISIEAGNVALDEGGQISTTTRGAGAAGAISIAASGGVLLQGEAIVGGVSQPSSIAARSETDADASSVSIAARTLDVLDGAQISTRALHAGRSGDVTLGASERISVQGAASLESEVSARAVDGPGGNLVVTAPILEVIDGGSLDVSSAGVGLGGQIVANVGTLTVAGASPAGREAVVAAEAQSAGDARGITITASDTIHVGSHGRISASSNGSGSPGDVALTAATIDIDGGNIEAQTFDGRGGNVALSAGKVKLGDGAQVTVSASHGDAGSIAISVARFVSVGSKVSALSPAFGGNVDIVANDFVNLVDSEIDATSQGGVNASGLAGGNITISPQAIVVNHSTLTANGFGNANGGNIFLTADPLLVSGDSAITASSQFGRQGTIVVTSPAAEISGDLAVLPSEFLDASSLLEESCLARSDVSGTFTVRSIGVLPPPPDAPFGPDAGAGEQCQPH